LALEDLEVGMAAADTSVEPPDAKAEPEVVAEPSPQRRRRGKPRVAADTPRERIVLDPGNDCPNCGGPLRLIGEDVSEILADQAQW